MCKSRNLVIVAIVEIIRGVIGINHFLAELKNSSYSNYYTLE